jgi:hypothetical protein
MQRVTKAFMAISTTAIVAITLWDIFTCRPVSLNWELGGKERVAIISRRTGLPGSVHFEHLQRCHNPSSSHAVNMKP